ncbi:hypothetical protein Tco_1115351 [Tanacetum coccineum]
MLAERRYPLTKETLERMLALRLIAEFENEVVFDLLRFIQKQIDESGSHDGKQTASGKDFSNPLMADSLPKTIWIVGFQKFLQLSAATYTSYYCQFYLVLLVKNAKDSRE